MQKGKFNIIIGGQAGSEAKGKLSGWLVDKEHPDILVMTSSPNAGHTIEINGIKKVSYHLPVGAIMSDCPVVLGPASLINMITLRKEIRDLEINPSRVHVDPRASIITSGHRLKEVVGGLENIGSTLQGVGACRMGKMKRGGNQTLVKDIPNEFHKLGVHIVGVASLLNKALDQGETVLCESTQGFDLDLEHGIDPVYCTSKMINPAMAMAEAGVSPSRIGDIYGVIRPYPIRVNNRTGTSGPYAEASELSWGEIAQWSNCPHELGEITTTTKLPRRVFEFSWRRFRHFVTVCHPTALCLQFANYISWGTYGVRTRGELPYSVLTFMAKLEKNGGVPVKFVGTGPGHEDMVEVDR